MFEIFDVSCCHQGPLGCRRGIWAYKRSPQGPQKSDNDLGPQGRTYPGAGKPGGGAGGGKETHELFRIRHMSPKLFSRSDSEPFGNPKYTAGGGGLCLPNTMDFNYCLAALRLPGFCKIQPPPKFCHCCGRSVPALDLGSISGPNL